MTHLPAPPAPAIPGGHPCLGCLAAEDAAKRDCARARLLAGGHLPDAIETARR
ncbi:hypothetical protein [Mangrovicoccus sp. HB161399]|uniref:hypothetical protein n=1 Tax=Mangrovicoccus sp. HB161399 TaxID=2720392 RepID=UPI00155400E4|nr:hypothetical protein [Mangrovicoccus sp. HB161399]